MTPTFKMVGVLRFSVLSSNFNMERFSNLDEAAEEIFSTQRMALRLRLFEHLCLPSLRRQSDQDFALVVATSDRMPDRYIEALLDMLAEVDNISLVPFAPQGHYNILRAAYRRVPRDQESHRILFRLDDDDAIDMGYVARTKQLAGTLLPVKGAKSPFVIAYNRGFYLQRHDSGSNVFDTVERAPLSVGTALVRPAGAGDNPYRFNHRKFAQHYNVFSDISVPGFIRTMHWDNHSQPAIMGLHGQMDEPAMDAGLRRHFGLNLSDLKAI